MIDEVNRVLDGSNLQGLTEIRELLQGVLGNDGSSGHFVSQQALKPSSLKVFRLRFVVNGETRSVIIKRLKPEVARKNELVADRWLPLIGLNDVGPPLLGRVATKSDVWVWHVYEDLFPWQLDADSLDRHRVRFAMELVARIHSAFENHPLLGEIRLHGGDLGIHFYECSMRDAIRGLQAWHAESQHRPLQERLLERLSGLRDELRGRAHILEALGGPETLVHGDFWTANVFVSPSNPLQTRFIDWDDAGVGPASYDLSTFLLRIPLEHRPWVLEMYRKALLECGRQLPSRQDLNLLFETYEYARIASKIIWPSIALATEGATWGVVELEEIERWFLKLMPVLPSRTEVAA